MYSLGFGVSVYTHVWMDGWMDGCMSVCMYPSQQPGLLTEKSAGLTGSIMQLS